MISRVLAVAGVSVTLIGVVMLLVLAAQAGFFGPLPRVLAGAAFSGALVIAGMRVFGRTGGRVGGIALAGTGIAGAYLDVVAVTAIYDWLPPVVGLVLALAVAGGGVGLAMRWGSQPLAALVVVGAAVLSPVVTSELVLLAFLIVLQLAFLPVQLVRDWPLLHVVRTLPAVLTALFFIAVEVLDGSPSHATALLLAAVAIAVIALAGVLLVARRRPEDITATLAFAVSTAPLLAAPTLFDRPAAVLVAGITAAVLLAVAIVPRLPKVGELLRVPGHTGTAAAVAGALALLQTCFGAAQGQTIPIALLLVALGFLGVAGQLRSLVAAGIGLAYTIFGGLWLFAEATPERLASQTLARDNLGTATALTALLALAVIATALWALRRLPVRSSSGTEESLVWLAGSLVALYAVTAATVSLGIASGVTDGFLIGHSIATILWMAGATGALLFGLRRMSTSAAIAKTALGSGLFVTAAALAKLFLFDLATLDGLVRVAAFLVVGVLLLLAGTRYARAFAEATSPPNPDPTPHGPQPN